MRKAGLKIRASDWWDGAPPGYHLRSTARPPGSTDWILSPASALGFIPTRNSDPAFLPALVAAIAAQGPQ
ncbi:hypothetical protein SRHO_G00164760 [Serrasalmus rhombeus]